MDKFVIHGGHRLTGEIEVSGAKNAAVALIPAVLLSDEPCVLENVPDISDVSISLQIMSEMGATVEYLTKTTVRISAAGLTNYCVPYESARKMRASYYFLGALLGRYGKARVSMPGGCPLGDRPIDQHLKAFAALGAKCNIEHGMVDLVADQLTGNQIYLDVVSVGATMNAMLAAVRAKGLTVIENAAKEPHIVDLANFLNSMGAEIMGAGTDVIKIRGVERLHGAVYSVIPDQIEAGTFMIAAAATKGDVLVTNVIPKHLEPITSKMRKIGVNIEEFDDSVRVWVDGPLVRTNVKTMPHPGFPTDMQPQITTLLTLAEGTSIITEGVWEQRFRYVDELRRMGADISVDGKVAVVEGTGKLTGAPVKACDLRAGAALIVAGLAAHGVTEIEDIYHIERGYANLDAKLRESMRFEIKELQKKFNFTIIFVTHDQSEAMALSDRMMVMDMGNIVQIGTPTELYNRPVNRFVHKFLGQSTFTDVVIQDGKVYAKGDMAQPLPVALPENGEREMVMATRPNQIEMNHTDGYKTKVEKRIFLTNYTEYLVRVGDQLLQVQTPHRNAFAQGETCYLKFPGIMWYGREDEQAEAERNRRQLV